MAAVQEAMTCRTLQKFRERFQDCIAAEGKHLDDKFFSRRNDINNNKKGILLLFFF